MQIFIVIFFNVIIFALGVFAPRLQKKKKSSSENLDDLTGRNSKMPLWVSLLTITATWVGGGYINGTAESAFSNGLLETIAPWAFSLSLIIAAIFFVTPFRQQNPKTFMDVFTKRFSKKFVAYLFIPALLGEIFWSSAILLALGATLSTLFDLSLSLCIWGSMFMAVIYTALGGMWSVACTDVAQLFLIALGLFIAVPYVYDHFGSFEIVWSNYKNHFLEKSSFLPATLDRNSFQWFDTVFYLVLGGIPWGSYFQRVLIISTDKKAKQVSIAAGFLCFLFAIPSLLFGIAGVSINWSNFAGIEFEQSMIIPFMLKQFTPPLICALGLSALTAAVMSSIDSSLLSIASNFSWNIYKEFRPASSQKEILWVTKISIVVSGFFAALLALNIKSVYHLWALSSDLVYVLLFPQLVGVLFFSRLSNTSFIFAFAMGSISRTVFYFLCEEIQWFQLWPYRSICVALSFMTLFTCEFFLTRKEKNEDLFQFHGKYQNN